MANGTPILGEIFGMGSAGHTPLVVDTEDDAIRNKAKELGVSLNKNTVDYLTQYYLNESSNEAAWKRQMEASNTEYQRAVEDLRKAGLNPFLALSSLSGNSPSSNGQAVTGGLLTQSKNSQRSFDAQKMTVLAIIAAAFIRAIA